MSRDLVELGVLIVLEGVEDIGEIIIEPLLKFLGTDDVPRIEHRTDFLLGLVGRRINGRRSDFLDNILHLVLDGLFRNDVLVAEEDNPLGIVGNEFLSRRHTSRTSLNLVIDGGDDLLVLILFNKVETD